MGSPGKQRCYNMLMFLQAYFVWWYRAGWQRLGQNVLRHIKRTYLGFSVAILFRTLFEPWRRIISTENETIGQKLRSALDNVISRAVGLVVRILALIAAGLLIVATVIFGVVAIILWPILPIGVMVLMVWGIIQ